MKKLDAFKKLIREEVRQVFREEIKTLLSEIKTTPATAPLHSSYKKSLKETLNPSATKKVPNVHLTGDPIKDLLFETATSMTGEEYKTLVNLGSNAAQGFPELYARPEVEVVSSVEDMIASTRPVHDINQVEIDSVPDFSALMQTLKSKGKI